MQKLRRMQDILHHLLFHIGKVSMLLCLICQNLLFFADHLIIIYVSLPAVIMLCFQKLLLQCVFLEGRGLFLLILYINIFEDNCSIDLSVTRQTVQSVFLRSRDKLSQEIGRKDFCFLDYLVISTLQRSFFSIASTSRRKLCKQRRT